MKDENRYQAIIQAPFGVLGIRCVTEALTGIEFLAPDIAFKLPDNLFAQNVCDQLFAYFKNSEYKFNLSLKLDGTTHQLKVWNSMCEIPLGLTRQYGEIAKEISSCPRAVGQACGSNPIPIIVPCHRVVGKTGLGGFAHHNAGYTLDIKRWLLAHEKH